VERGDFLVVSFAGCSMNLFRSKKLKMVLGRAAGVSGAYARHFRSKMTIVAFHRVNDHLPGDDGLTCGTEKFSAFCQFFKKYFAVIPLPEQIAGCQAGRNMGGTLSITFDDGYLDNYEVAAPILRKLDLPATFFVTSGFIDSQLTAPWDTALPVRPRWMGWEHLRGLVAQGFEIGSHTHTHINMANTDLQVIRAELALSKRRIFEELGVRADLFAYPFGGREHISESALELVREAGFKCCVACYGGVNSPGADPFRLNRIGIAEWFDTPHQLGFEIVTNRTELLPAGIS
jgi:peptidoglycan/xylan/chitin deacetylase (PgdA/CDA1 family)